MYVGSGTATEILHEGDEVTVTCCEGAEGHVYGGRIAFTINEFSAEAVPRTGTQVMLTRRPVQRLPNVIDSQ
jgi:pyruvate,water dikinase